MRHRGICFFTGIQRACKRQCLGMARFTVFNNVGTGTRTIKSRRQCRRTFRQRDSLPGQRVTHNQCYLPVYIHGSRTMERGIKQDVRANGGGTEADGKYWENPRLIEAILQDGRGR